MKRRRLTKFWLIILAGLVFFPGKEAPANVRLSDLRFTDPPAPRIPLNEEVLRIPMKVTEATGERHIFLEATLFRPEGAGPFPLVVLSHGTPRELDHQGGRQRFEAQSWAFVNMGLAVVIPMRRGYGRSQGSYAEEEGLCDQARYYEAGMESAKDLLATVRFLSAQPFIEAGRIVLAGHSSGGFASLALASRGFPGLQGVINFSGGRGSRADKVCSPPELIEAFAKFGSTTRVPTLWLYAENDTYFPPALVRELHRAFQGGGGKAQLIMLSPFFSEGHYFFFRCPGLALVDRHHQSFSGPAGDTAACPQAARALAEGERQQRRAGVPVVVGLLI